MFDWKSWFDEKFETVKNKENPVQFLALLEALAGVINPSNISDVVNLVEKLIALGEQAAAAAQQSQKQS